MPKKENVVRDRSYSFALKIIDLHRQIRKQREFVISNQLLRSGTSIGANIEEATAALTKKDFIYKMAIASKEARETHYWLRLLRDSDFCDSIDLSDNIDECEELVRILTAIVKTSQRNF